MHIELKVIQPAKPARGASLRWLLAAPHRLFFALGATNLALVSLWWLAVLTSRALETPLVSALPPSWLHAWSMLNGFLPLFMFGFLFTAGPRWLGLDGPAARRLLWPGLVAALGVPLTLVVGPVWSAFVPIAAVAVAGAWSVLLFRFAGLIRASRVADQAHARAVLVWFCFGAASHAAYALGASSVSAAWIQTAHLLTIWFFIAPVYVTVAHRLIPFFTAAVLPMLDAWRPLWLLGAMNAIVLAHGVLALGNVWLPARGWVAAMLAVDIAGTLLLAFLLWRWGTLQSLRNRLLAMLHLGFAWLGIALLLYAGDDGARLIGFTSLGLAPLHALTMGFFGTVLYAMATRVTAGHSGRALVADDFIWALFWLLQIAIGTRIGVDLAAPVWADGARWLPLAAILLWCGVVVPWALRNLRIYLRPRADGRPG